jgi:MinD-like ATPase involved in chromosome partitioning or flagellar assembly
VADPSRVAILQTKALVAELVNLGIAATKIEVVMVNRSPSSIQMSWSQAEQLLGSKIATVVTPAAELAHQSVEAGTPMVLLRPESLTAEQLRQLTTQVLQKIRLS